MAKWLQYEGINAKMQLIFLLLYENELWDTKMGKFQLLKDGLHSAEVIIFVQLIIPFKSIPYWYHYPEVTPCSPVPVSRSQKSRQLERDLQSAWVSAESTVCSTHSSGSGLVPACSPELSPSSGLRKCVPSKQNTACALMAAPQWELKGTLLGND